MGIIQKIEPVLGSTQGDSIGSSMRSFALHCLQTFMHWRERARQRRHLAMLDARMLEDIGQTEDDVARECGKYPWQR